MSRGLGSEIVDDVGRALPVPPNGDNRVEVCDCQCGIAAHQHQVSLFARCEYAAIIEAQQLRCVFGRERNGLQWR